MKFALGPSAARNLIESRPVTRAAIGKPVTRRLQSTYFDTRQHLLRKSGVALRVRSSGDRHQQTIKIPAPGPVGLASFFEWTVELDRPEPDWSRFDDEVVRRFNPRRRPLKLKPVFTTHIERTTMLLERDGTRFEMALDRGEIESHLRLPRREPVCEVEFELLDGPVPPLLDFALELNETLQLRSEHRTKAQRGFALARPALAARPARARPVSLEPGMSVGDAFRRVVGEALTQLYQNEAPTMAGVPEGIHQARVAIRRIRAALRAFKRSLPYDKRKAFNGEFRWFQNRLARARDWHVFLDETLAGIQRSRPQARVNLERLRKLARRERRRATLEAADIFRGRRYTRLLLQFQRWLATLERDHRRMFDAELLPQARALLNRARRDFLRDQRPLSRMTVDELHELRKRGKKTRYATEFFADLWPAESSEPFIATLKAVQNRLGEVNDAVMARQVVATLPPRSLKSSTIALVQDWSEGQVRARVRSCQPAWRAIQRAQPFWRQPAVNRG